jgi:lipoyl(octanoyl) transferase
MPVVDWHTSVDLVPYLDALTLMEQRAADIAKGTANEWVWLLEHPPLYTGGTSAKAQDLLNTGNLPVYNTGRGGQYTWHGPGQRVIYVMLCLKRTYFDVRLFVYQLEEWLIQTLAILGVKAMRRLGRIGIWVETQSTESKIAALGIRIRRGVSFHGLSLNVSPDLTYFQGIVPCGLTRYGVTSLQALGAETHLPTIDSVLQTTFYRVFS